MKKKNKKSCEPPKVYLDGKGEPLTMTPEMFEEVLKLYESGLSFNTFLNKKK